MAQSFRKEPSPDGGGLRLTARFQSRSLGGPLPHYTEPQDANYQQTGSSSQKANGPDKR
jgi:hypothetical protein